MSDRSEMKDVRRFGEGLAGGRVDPDLCFVRRQEHDALVSLAHRSVIADFDPGACFALAPGVGYVRLTAEQEDRITAATKQHPDCWPDWESVFDFLEENRHLVSRPEGGLRSTDLR